MWDHILCTPPVVCDNPEAIDGLEAALVRYDRKAAKFAVEHGCNPNGPIRVCVTYAYGRLFRFEVDKEFVRTRAPKMFYYAFDVNPEAVKMLVEVCGADILARDDDGHTLLHAIAMGHANWVCYHGNHLRSESDANARRKDPEFPQVRFCLPFAVPFYLISNCSYPQLWAWVKTFPGFESSNGKNIHGQTADDLCHQTFKGAQAIYRTPGWAADAWNDFFIARSRAKADLKRELRRQARRGWYEEDDSAFSTVF